MDAFLGKVYTVVLQPIIFLLFGVAFLIFIWGLVKFIKDKDTDEGRATGWRNIFYGILGMVIMVSVFGIITIIAGTIGADVPGNPQTIQGDIDRVNVQSDL
jgi:hypothetical protein